MTDSVADPPAAYSAHLARPKLPGYGSRRRRAARSRRGNSLSLSGVASADSVPPDSEVQSRQVTQ